jgi:hypothetical protein
MAARPHPIARQTPASPVRVTSDPVQRLQGAVRTLMSPPAASHAEARLQICKRTHSAVYAPECTKVSARANPGASCARKKDFAGPGPASTPSQTKSSFQNKLAFVHITGIARAGRRTSLEGGIDAGACLGGRGVDALQRALHCADNGPVRMRQRPQRVLGVERRRRLKGERPPVLRRQVRHAVQDSQCRPIDLAETVQALQQVRPDEPYATAAKSVSPPPS